MKKLIQLLIDEHFGVGGRMISPSKSSYTRLYPENKVYFNACIFDKSIEQIWWGDIDLTFDAEKLNKIAERSGEVFYVTPEHPFRSDFHTVTKRQLENDEFVIKFNGGN